MAKFGKYNEDGSVQREATECALTERDVNPENSVREPVKGTDYFVRIIGHQYERVTDDDRAKWAGEAGKLDTPKPAPVVLPKAAKTSEVKE